MGILKHVVRICLLMVFSIYCYADEVDAQDIVPEDFHFFTSTDVGVQEVPRSELIDIYLGRKRFWPNSSRIVVIVYERNTPESKLIEPIINISSLHLTRHWRRLAFTGQGRMPITVNSEAEMLDMLKSTPNAIGYSVSRPESIDITPLKVIDPKANDVDHDSLNLFPYRIEELIVLNRLSDKPNQSRL